ASSTFFYRIDWNGDGSDVQIVQGPSSIQVEHDYFAAGSYGLTVTVLNASGASTEPMTLASPFEVAALTGPNLDAVIQSQTTVTLDAKTTGQLNTATGALDNVAPTSWSQVANSSATVMLGPGDYTTDVVASATSPSTTINVVGTGPNGGYASPFGSNAGS